MCIRDRARGLGARRRVPQPVPGHGPALQLLGLPACALPQLSLIHISEPTRLLSISYAVFCLKKKIRLDGAVGIICIIYISTTTSASVFFFNDTATTEIYTRKIVGSVRCV